MDGKLIELVRSKPELYDLSHCLYSDNNHKKKVWDDIGRALHKTDVECKQRWLSLRGQFRKVRQKHSIAMASGQATSLRRWKYEEGMSFLLPHMKDKERTSWADVDTEGEGECKDTEGTEVEAREPDADGSLSMEETSQLSDFLPKPVSSPLAPLLSRRKPIRSRKAETVPVRVVKYLLGNCKKPAFERNEKTTLNLFFEAMLATVKTFSPSDQHRVKSQIFSLVSGIEAQYLESPSPFV